MTERSDSRALLCIVRTCVCVCVCAHVCARASMFSRLLGDGPAQLNQLYCKHRVLRRGVQMNLDKAWVVGLFWLLWGTSMTQGDD